MIGLARSSRIGTTPPADATCAGDQVQPFPAVDRAFFSPAHRSSPLSTAPVIAAGRASVIGNR